MNKTVSNDAVFIAMATIYAGKRQQSMNDAVAETREMIAKAGFELEPAETPEAANSANEKAVREFCDDIVEMRVKQNAAIYISSLKGAIVRVRPVGDAWFRDVNTGREIHKDDLEPIETLEAPDHTVDANEKILRVRIVKANMLDGFWHNTLIGEEFDVEDNGAVWFVASGKYKAHSIRKSDAEEITDHLPDVRKLFTPLVITAETEPTHKWEGHLQSGYVIPLAESSDTTFFYDVHTKRASGGLSKNIRELTPEEIAEWKENQK